MKWRPAGELLIAVWMVLVVVCYLAWVILPKLQGKI